jgi:HSP90 family molecular chaperone
MTTDSILNGLEELEDVTNAERAEGTRTYVVDLYGAADIEVLRKIEHISGWTVTRFDGVNGSDIRVVCVDQEDQEQR